MEATIKFNEEEIVEMCVERCKSILPPQNSMRWTGTFERYSGVECKLEEIPAKAPLSSFVSLGKSADDDPEVAF
jgi:hypothetical protein